MSANPLPRGGNPSFVQLWRADSPITALTKDKSTKAQPTNEQGATEFEYINNTNP